MMDLQGADRFAAELRALGYEPERSANGTVCFEYVIENGPWVGRRVRLGFQVPPNFPIEPPHGPCYADAILRGLGITGVHPGHAIGPAWDHWSRPCEGW